MKKFIHSYLTKNYVILRTKHRYGFEVKHYFDSISSKTSSEYISGDDLVNEISITFSLRKYVVRKHINSWAKLSNPKIDLKTYWTNKGALSFTMKSVRIDGIPRRLNARWSVDLTTNLYHYHGIDAETELTAILSNHLGHDIDRCIIDDITTND